MQQGDLRKVVPLGKRLFKPKEQTINDLGFIKKQGVHIEQLADNKDIIEEAKTEAPHILSYCPLGQ